LLVTRHSVAHELTALNLLNRAAIVDGGFRVQEQIGRHRVFTVTSGDDNRYLVKQATPANDTWQKRTITNEARCLRFAAGDADLRPHIPALIHLNEGRQLLIQEFIDGPNLHRDGIIDPDSRQKIATEIGKTLATVHRRMLPLVTDNGDAGANRRLPWILTDNRPWLPGAVGWKSPVIGLAAVLRQFPDIDQSLTETGRHWREDA
jgi:hypothetical protein